MFNLKSIMQSPYLTGKIIRCLFAISFFLFYGSGGYAQQKEQTILFSITGNGSSDTSWLFGTYHLVKSDYLNQMPAVLNAFNKARGVVVEIVADSAQLMAAQQKGVMQHQTLYQLFDKPFLDSLEHELKSSLGVGIEQLNRLKPMSVTLTLSAVYLMKNNQETLARFQGQPIDLYFASNGKKRNKTITPLETMEQQMDLLFEKTPVQEQSLGLQAFLRNKETMIKLGDDLLKSWLNRDLDAMEAIYTKTLALSGEEDYLVRDRNLDWMKTLPDLIRKQSGFIAVGALHLPGESGLIRLLREKGFTVTPVKL